MKKDKFYLIKDIIDANTGLSKLQPGEPRENAIVNFDIPEDWFQRNNLRINVDITNDHGEATGQKFITSNFSGMGKKDGFFTLNTSNSIYVLDDVTDRVKENIRADIVASRESAITFKQIGEDKVEDGTLTARFALSTNNATNRAKVIIQQTEFSRHVEIRDNMGEKLFDSKHGFDEKDLQVASQLIVNIQEPLFNRTDLTRDDVNKALIAMVNNTNERMSEIKAELMNEFITIEYRGDKLNFKPNSDSLSLGETLHGRNGVDITIKPDGQFSVESKTFTFTGYLDTNNFDRIANEINEHKNAYGLADSISLDDIKRELLEVVSAEVDIESRTQAFNDMIDNEHSELYGAVELDGHTEDIADSELGDSDDIGSTSEDFDFDEA